MNDYPDLKLRVISTKGTKTLRDARSKKFITDKQEILNLLNQK